MTAPDDIDDAAGAQALPDKGAEMTTEERQKARQFKRGAEFAVRQYPEPPPPEVRATWKVDQPTPEFLMMNRGNRQCTAASKQTGQRCMMVASSVHDVCRWHGARGGHPGKSLNYTQSLGRLGVAYANALQDSRLTDLRRPLAALHVLTQRQLERFSEGETPELRKRGLELAKEAAGCAVRSDAEGLAKSLQALCELMESGVSEDKALAAATSAITELSERLEVYNKIQLDRKQAISAQDLVGVLARVADVIRQALPPHDARDVCQRIEELMLSRSALRGDSLASKN